MTDPLNITVLGAGMVGGNLARRLDGLGHHITLGARDPNSDKIQATLAAVPTATVARLGDSTADANVVILAVPFPAAVETLAAVGPLDGKILIDATNAVGVQLPPGHNMAVSVVAAADPTARVVKAFNTIGAEHFLDHPIGNASIVLPIAGEDSARHVVAALATDMGFDVIETGDLDTAHHVEAFAAMWIHLALRRGYGRGIAFQLLRE